MMLGVFHFSTSNDTYQRQFPFDIREPRRQREVEQLVGRLDCFAPTIVAVEALPERQARLDSLYRAYRNGTYVLGPNEIYQLGFRVAARFGLEGVRAVDARQRSYISYPEYRARLRELGQEDLADFARAKWGPEYRALFRFDDSVRATRDMITELIYRNSSERLRIGAGADFYGGFLAGTADDHLGADWSTQWYNRNLRIFSNILRLIRSPDERVLLIIGSSHVPLLKFMADASPDVDVLDVSPLLRGRCPEAATSL